MKTEIEVAINWWDNEIPPVKREEFLSNHFSSEYDFEKNPYPIPKSEQILHIFRKEVIEVWWQAFLANEKVDLIDKHVTPSKTSTKEERMFEIYYKEVFEKPLTEPSFLEYIKSARRKFAKFINSLEWNRDLRTEVDSLLIAYDQMADKVELANSQTTIHLKKLIKEVKEKVRTTSNCTNWNCQGESIDKQSIDQVLNDYITNNELK